MGERAIASLAEVIAPLSVSEAEQARLLVPLITLIICDISEYLKTRKKCTTYLNSQQYIFIQYCIHIVEISKALI